MKNKFLRTMTVASIAAILISCPLVPDNGDPPGNGTTQYTVGGIVFGLPSAGLVLQNNGADDLSIVADGTFSFSAPLADGAG